MKFFEDFSTSTICKHNPSGEINPLKRFFDYFFRKRSLWDYYTNTAVCYTCGEFVTFPTAYTNPVMGLVYLMSAFLVGLPSCYLFVYFARNELPILSMFVFTVVAPAILLVYNVVDSFVLSHYSWQCCEKENDVLLRKRHAPGRNRYRKLQFGFSGCLLGMRIALYFF